MLDWRHFQNVLLIRDDKRRDCICFANLLTRRQTGRLASYGHFLHREHRATLALGTLLGGEDSVLVFDFDLSLADRAGIDASHGAHVALG